MIRVFSQYVSVKCIGLMLWDALLVIVCLIAAVKIRFFESPAEFAAHTMLPDFAAQVLVAVMSYMVCFYFNEMYDPHVIRAPEKHPYRLCESLGAACILLGLLYFLIPTVLISRGVFLISLTLLATAISLSRATFRMVWLESASRRPVLILGTGQLAMTVAREMTIRDDLNFEVTGLVSTSNTKSEILPASLFGHPILGSSDSLAGIAARHKITRIVVACEDRRNSLPVLALMSLRVRGVIVEEAHAALAALTGRVWLDIVRPSWFVYSGGFRRSRLHAIVKRMVDIAAGLLGLLLASPILLAVAIAVRLDSSGPVLFRQWRTGLGGKPFEIFKFRSMHRDAEVENGAQWAAENDPRVTRVGKWLRIFRLDELPQFYNILRGDMSLIGPRPERPVFVEQLCRQIPYFDERHSVRPGLTGWAQVQYRYAATREDAIRKLEYDLFYLQNMSVLFDCAILMRTVPIVLFGRGGR